MYLPSRIIGILALGFFTAVVIFQAGRSFERAKWKARVDALAEQVLIIEEEIDRLNSKYEVLYAVIQCESSGRHEVWGDGDYRYPAYGIAQMQERTFYWLAGKAGLENADWKSREHQIRLLSWGIENGYGSLWTCYRKYVASKEGGENAG